VPILFYTRECLYYSDARECLYYSGIHESALYIYRHSIRESAYIIAIHESAYVIAICTPCTGGSSPIYRGDDIGMQHTATHCNTLQHAATHCNSLHVEGLRIVLIWVYFMT